MSNTNRTKGHTLERTTAKQMREIGFSKAKTSREASRLLDNCKVDIANIPLLIQCKNGYEKSRPKFEVLKGEAIKLIKENFLDKDKIYELPYILRHKFPKNDLAVIEWDFFMILLKNYVTTNEELFKDYL